MTNPTDLQNSTNIRRMSGQVLTRVDQSSSRRLSGQSSTERSTVLARHRNVQYGAEDATGSKFDDDGHVRVAVRCRPMSVKERLAEYDSIVEIESDKRIVVHDVSDAPSDQLGTRSGERKNFSHVYDFDIVFDEQATQQAVYDRACRPIVASVLEGYNGTILAYGQTGTGKTFTMEGLPPRGNNGAEISHNKLPSDKRGSLASAKSESKMEPSRKESNSDQHSRLLSQTKVLGTELDHEAGIIHRSFHQIFQHVAANSEIQFLIRVSYVEIYQESIRDLLRRDKSMQKLELHERSDIGVYVKDLTSFVCKSIGEIERVMRVGNQNRIVGATDMNEHSSRSHAIFMITIEQQQLKQYQKALETRTSAQLVASRGPNAATVTATALKSRRGTSAASGDINDFSRQLQRQKQQQQQVIRVGKLNLVDLAGSERQRKTNSFGQRQRESIKINLSLSALGNVINSLIKLQQQQQQARQSNNSAFSVTHTPYRDSKLTRLLQDSLGGNAKTLMIANIGPASYNYEETINTLNYASRARCIKNRPRLNEDPKDALLRELQQEIDLLRMKLANSRNQNVSSQQKQGSNSSIGNIVAATNVLKNNHSVDMELFELKQKLSSLEGKLLNGYSSVDQNLLKGLTMEQENELKRQRGELANQENREKVIRDELEQRVEAELVARQSFESVQQEVEAKRRLIRQILLKIKTLRDEIEANQRGFRIELDELEQLHSVLQRGLKLKCLIMDNFIPNCHVDQLLSNIVYDAQKNVCQIKRSPMKSALAPEQCSYNIDNGSALKDKEDEDLLANYWQPTYDSIRPRSEFERISDAIYPNNIRYKYENLIEPTLEPLPHENRLRAKPNNPIINVKKLAHSRIQNKQRGATPHLQALIDQALDEREPDIVI